MSGDKLASGATSAKFTSNDGTVTQDKWNEMFKDFDREKFVNETKRYQQSPESERETTRK